MPRKKKDAAEKAVDKIFEDLRGRHTLKWMFATGAAGPSKIDDETQEDIRQTWIGLVRKAFKAGEMPKGNE